MSRQKIVVLALSVVTAVAWAPFAAVLVAGAAATAFDCRVDEGSAHPCVVGAVDIGPALYVLGVSGWLMLATFPLMLLTLVGWLAFGLWVAVRRYHGKKLVG